jgi:hypothetical protein
MPPAAPYIAGGDSKPPTIGPNWTLKEAPAEPSAYSVSYHRNTSLGDWYRLCLHTQVTSIAAGTVEFLWLYLIAWFTGDRL